MPEDPNELLAEGGRLASVVQFALLPPSLLVRFELKGDEAGDQVEDLEVLRIQIRREGVEGAERAKVAAIATQERDRDVTLNAEERAPWMVRETRISARLVDEERCDRTADDTSVGRRQLKLVSGFEPESRVIQHGAGGPRVLGHARHQGDTQARGTPEHT
ncbi:MAG TPA: hypothetical protein VGR16_03685 [Thermomicrobiales bacterium]|nr:hypothetical protein [Thermomicrobiales bacterium]